MNAAARDAQIVTLQAELLDHTGHVNPGLAPGPARRLVTEINRLRRANKWAPLDMKGRRQR